MNSPSFNHLVTNMLAAHPGERVCQFEYEGKKYWLKQTERLQGAMRLLKADPHQSFLKEVRVLQRLAELQAPVPKLIQADEHYLVLEDVGPTVNQWLSAPGLEPACLQSILNDSAKALAGLHKMALAHGRPALRDISWQQGRVTFIDFEANQQGSNLLMQQIRDLLVYIHSLYRYLGPAEQMIGEAIKHYRNTGGERVWRHTQTLLAGWQWLGFLLRPFRHRGGRDLKPIYWVLRSFRAEQS
ncbi:lipopolysaccharide kinase InaA family protein [Shewanella salipaludis]|uniref:Phosphotransferase n=1 Tax=Shewanella salipaludis TaxID=2723052 RepID=A0A972FXZ2_9GAMM|nr:RIO1 family regulatory kinase/ATPase [Shewanella salipaludis]NMH63599.1 phosphotransferase [Shewanella salipaludis]